MDRTRTVTSIILIGAVAGTVLAGCSAPADATASFASSNRGWVVEDDLGPAAGLPN